MFTTSSSSSPDVLGPSGDTDYLISSPIKSFSGRQSSFMSPANFKLLQTPRPGKGKTSRFSFTPAKSAHSIRFDDVLLPASPSINLNGQPGSLSPNKAQGDRNLSPWRIRVTLEATQDEEANEANERSPARKRLRPSETMTTKVPLKAEQDQVEQTPRRRRGRPRKSDIQGQDVIPIPGSPGNTPGPGGASGQKRKRGRPRKQLLDLDTVEDGELEAGEPATDQLNDQAIPIIEPEREWSPLDLAGDPSSDDGLPDDPMSVDPFEPENQMERPDATAWDRSSPRVPLEQMYETPDVGAVDQVYGQNDDEHLHSTPSKMPSPSRDARVVSPANTLHAGRTPRPRRLYPTPTSSSLIDEEKAEQAEAVNTVSNDDYDQNEVHTTNDPTDEHREFDSIMESEGFSMVSLDTLPSAKQHALSTSSKIAKSALKPFLERETIRMERKASAVVHKNYEDSLTKTSQPDRSLTEQLPSNATLISPEPELAPERRSSGNKYSSTRDKPSPVLSPAVIAPTPVARQAKPSLRLASIVRVGVALEGTLRRLYEGAPLPSPGMSDLRDQISNLEGPRKRLELLFSDFNARIRRELRAGLGLAQELAKRRRKAEIERARQMLAVRVSAKGNREMDKSETPLQERVGAITHSSPSSEMKRRMEEWQREREAVSRRIQMANSSQVIVVDSDESGPPSPELNANMHESQTDYEYEHESDLGEEEPHPESEDDQVQELYGGGDDDDEGYEDIWQQEARDQSNISHDSPVPHNQDEDMVLRQDSSPSKNDSNTSSGENGRILSPAHWASDHDKVPFLGMSRVRQLREQEVDLSTLLRAENTPNRNRYYYGKSSPASTANGRSPERPELADASPEEEAGDDMLEEDQHSAMYPESSPHRALDDDTFLIDPTTRHENEMQRTEQALAEHRDGSIAGTPLADDQSVHETTITPKHSRHTTGDVQASSWFQRITSLTPGWLKAPAKWREQPSPASSENISDDEDEELPETSPTKDTDQVYWEDLEATPRQLPQLAESNDEQQSSPVPRPHQRIDNAQTSLQAEANTEMYEAQLPLAVTGYFTDEHYSVFRRLYHLEKRHPDRFPYYPAPGHSDIIGDWIWTSDGAHGVQVTESQFAIIDRFVQELARTDLQAGGTGQIGWTEADLHRRLISIIIGEQIREEIKAKRREEESTVEHPRSGVAATTTTWRR